MPPSIADAYRAGTLRDFFRFTPDDLDAARAESPRDVDRAALASALRAYHSRLGTLDAGVEAQLARLAHPRSRVVVTGQQAGLLTGPAYSVHKGADAVLLARALDRDDEPVVPIYWVASQDHDVDEVAGVSLLDMDETPVHLRLDLPRGRMVGRVAWQPAWSRAVEDVLDRFSAPPEHVSRVRELVRRSEGGSWADVFARLVHGLLGREGLVVLDPLEPELAALFAPALERELRAPTRSSALIEEAAGRLERLGFEPQLRRPEGATNLFLECEDGQRRLLRVDGRTLHADRSYTAEDVLAILASDPTRVTPAAGLRPVVQDSVLPTVAFVVGPGEIAYGAQLREVYALHGLPQPLLWPRLSVTWLEP
ncbi:bacillithiol biosynthesis cysteine-adding enzyme BshC, partial [Deinococcus pimensis]|uniref:bacillithiol biosynthesis cysteine-adding enzyme BshC n=1 Tax=Deinococcus pimensis TaxID=309888 RepID=UPI000489EDBA